MKTVLITGCSSGIGRALCEKYLTKGFHVYASARNIRSLNDLDEHSNLTKLTLDVNSQSSIHNAIAHIKQDNNYLDVLINNAGYAAMGPLADMPLEDLRAQFETNVFAPMELTKACLPFLMAKKELAKKETTKNAQQHNAQVVNIGSVSGITTTPFSGAYCATKAALHSLSDAQRMELAPFGIDVITVQPGAIESKFGDNSLNNVLARITPQSLYAPLKEAIQARATASQDNPTPAAEFADTLVEQLLNNPKAVIRIGNGSFGLPLLKRWLPVAILDKILSKKFNLTSLAKR
ncbi:MAG: SDR family oxidoreductase [Oleispira antarctica]|uniref:Short-chain dehydrogenase/reductase SDR n=1 Tax=Oleispira antarctica RB-8 TaxID=698738 RepID=R4YUU2_OLEAN|nr:SDR family oxidoreductase [Oleispira antarctica]MBQ0793497.1 SDR family oxidoreductase [Oleispira antarctica]CCK77044.1 Short-chain dehydrogenase/reductase SDR precursor [Oleispira antarctica RB-8]|tara:strand:- start:2117 stop:2992 length:876 start_codon:yes stop_codon:yes gene_type:complete